MESLIDLYLFNSFLELILNDFFFFKNMYIFHHRFRLSKIMLIFKRIIMHNKEYSVFKYLGFLNCFINIVWLLKTISFYFLNSYNFVFIILYQLKEFLF